MADCEVCKIFVVSGQVQGVGFRPYVWKLAKSCSLRGNIYNTSQGVRIEAQGRREDVLEFERRLKPEAPPLAKINGIEIILGHIREGLTNFEIMPSVGHKGQNVLIGSDTSVCKDCLLEMRNPDDVRFAYPFINCTNCGPRYSITSRIPYDRANTSMGCFLMCPKCAKEYKDPADRRFHAQPLACPDCGPQVWFVDEAAFAGADTQYAAEKAKNAIPRLGKALLKGKIAAIRGLGGFQLVCDARNDAAVALLRKRKHRPHKALAVMAADLEAARQVCLVEPAHLELLTGRQKPIVVCPLLPGANVSDLIAPDTNNIGLMLPYTPMHALLMDWLQVNGMPQPILVMTSGNAAGSPICLGNREALQRLGKEADVYLLHNRDILCRVDDSVVLPQKSGSVFLRRARGYVPEPLVVPNTDQSVLGTGGVLKATFCLTRQDQAFLSQHIGDLESPAVLDFYEETLAHMQGLLEVRPELVVHDLHPDLMSSKFARDYAAQNKVKSLALQHHVAHASACLAENGCFEPALAICLDGTGLGTDGSIWGGEIMEVDLSRPSWKRLGSLETFSLPGGEAAILEPWRIAVALGAEDLNPRESSIRAMLERGINCLPCSSSGRLFDAVAAHLGLCQEITYEGQAAIRLEKHASSWLAQNGSPQEWTPPIRKHDGLYYIDSKAIFSQMDRSRPDLAAAFFHYALARGFAEVASLLARQLGIKKVALSGGVLQNCIIAEILPEFLQKAGLVPLLHVFSPPGDGSISYGQAVWGIQKLAAGL